MKRLFHPSLASASIKNKANNAECFNQFKFMAAGYCIAQGIAMPSDTMLKAVYFHYRRETPTTYILVGIERGVKPALFDIIYQSDDQKLLEEIRGESVHEYYDLGIEKVEATFDAMEKKLKELNGGV